MHNYLHIDIRVQKNPTLPVNASQHSTRINKEISSHQSLQRFCDLVKKRLICVSYIYICITFKSFNSLLATAMTTLEFEFV